MIYNKKTNKIGGRNRRGVGAIIGGVILAAILLSTVFAFFMSMLQNEQARAGYQIQSEQQSRDKEIEEYAVSRYVENGILYVNVTNTGPIPIAESHWALYCTTCTNPTVPVISSIAKTLNPGEEDGARAIGTVNPGQTYVLQVISERGNIITTEDCKVIGPSAATRQCADSDGALTDSGPIQLDTQAFGSIYQDLASRGNVDQRGWDVVVSSAFGNVTGYPGFHIPAGIDVAYTQHVRSLDESGQDLTLNRDTLLSNIDAGRKVTQPIDVVFSIDSSGSMVDNDPTFLRLTAAHTFIDKLTQGVDQAAIVSWDGDDDDECVYEVPIPSNCTPNPGAAGADSDWFQSLTFNLNQVKHGATANPVNSGKSVCNIPASPPQQLPQTTCGIDDIDNIGGGGTNLEVGLYKAIEVMDANTRVEPSNQIIIFLTDGKVEGGPPFDYTLSHDSGPAADAQARGYKIYVIGLIDFDVGKLSDTAAATDGGLYLTASAANLDTIFLDIHAKSILTTTIPDIVYVCKENVAARTLNAYSEVSPNNKVLPATAPDADSTVGWQEVFFCSRTPGTAGNDYKPQNDFTSFHPLIMVVRGQFSNILEEEGQTIPYQSSAVGAQDITAFNACSKTGNTAVDCAAPTVVDNGATMIYSRTIGQMGGAGSSVWIHVNTVTTPITVSWLYPDGTTKNLNMTNGAAAKDVALNANKNTPFAVRLPTQNSNGTPISCIPNLPGTFDSYTIRVTNQYDAEGRRDVYYMTFRVTGC